MFALLKFKGPLIWTVAGALLVSSLVFAGWRLYENGYQAGETKMTDQYHNEKLAWQNRVLAAQFELSVVNSQLVEAINNRVVEKEIVTRYIKSDPEIITKYIEKEVDCTVPKGFVEFHNKAAQNASKEELDSISDINRSELSDKSLSDAARVVGSNYYEYNELRVKYMDLLAVLKTYQDKQRELIDE